MTAKSLLYVIAQFVLFILFATIPTGYAAIFGWQLISFILVILGGILASKAIIQHGTHLTPSPSPTINSRLIITGAYKRIRHPVYTGLLLIASGISLYSMNIPRALLTFLLFLLFYNKSKYEETMLEVKFPAYADYRNKAGRFFPFIFRKKT